MRCQPVGSVQTTSCAGAGGAAGLLGADTAAGGLGVAGALEVASGSALREQPETTVQSISAKKEIFLMLQPPLLRQGHGYQIVSMRQVGEVDRLGQGGGDCLGNAIGRQALPKEVPLVGPDHAVALLDIEGHDGVVGACPPKQALVR